MSGSATDSEKPSDAGHRWRRTRVMASTKVGDGLSYQAALRRVMGWRFCNAWAARVVQENSPSRTGVGAGNGQVGPLALGLHAQVGAHLLKGDLQLPAQDKPFQDLGRVINDNNALPQSKRYPT